MTLTLYGDVHSRASMPRWYLEEKGLACDWYRSGTKQGGQDHATPPPKTWRGGMADHKNGRKPWKHAVVFSGNSIVKVSGQPWLATGLILCGG
jgi:hypothetical protein